MEGKAEKLLKDLGRKIDSFLEELNGATDNLQDEFKQRFEELKKSKDSLGDNFKEFKEKNKGKWEEVEAQLEKAGKEVKAAFRTAFSNRDKRKDDKD